jgi:hypothetical protein
MCIVDVLIVSAWPFNVRARSFTTPKRATDRGFLTFSDILTRDWIAFHLNRRPFLTMPRVDLFFAERLEPIWVRREG